jgi:hypothetical protein
MTAPLSPEEENQVVRLSMELLAHLETLPPPISAWDEVDDIMTVVVALQKFGYAAERYTQRLTTVSSLSYVMDAIVINKDFVFDAKGVRGWDAICLPIYQEHHISKSATHVHHVQSWLDYHNEEELSQVQHRIGEVSGFLQAFLLQEQTPNSAHACLQGRRL